jgi:predicted permease
MNALINVVIPVFGIILTGYLAGRFGVLGPESAAALNRFVYYFAIPCALFIFAARAPIDIIFNWPFIGAFSSGSVLTLLIALIVGRLWFRHDTATLSVAGVTAVFGQVGMSPIGAKAENMLLRRISGFGPTRISSAAFQGSPLSRPKNTIAFAPDFGVRGRAR